MLSKLKGSLIKKLFNDSFLSHSLNNNHLALAAALRDSTTRKRCQHTYPGDSDNGQYISFTERQVLFVGSLEVVLGYTLCASRPRCLHHTRQKGRLVNHSDVTGFGLCFALISRRVMQLLGDGKHCY